MLAMLRHNTFSST